MENYLIMPKQTAQLDAFFASLQIYYNAYTQGEKWVKNSDYKQSIQNLLPRLTDGARDGAFLVKQSEMTRYFGLVFYDYKGRKAYITKSGIKFYEAYLKDNKNLQLDILFESILNHSFGRNNTAIRDSDSDIDPPKLFIKASYDLGGITNKDFSYLLYLVNDKNICYGDACIELANIRESNYILEIPREKTNKYKDIKFSGFLSNIGFFEVVDKKCEICNYIKENYYDELTNISIYNKEPQFIYTINPESDFEFGMQGNTIVKTLPYDIESEKFKSLNNRIPEINDNSRKNTRYKTNSRISKTAIDLAKYKCEIDNNHVSFKSKLNENYMESHHLVPMSAQVDFSSNLDRIENIVCLCPLCHKAIHYGEKSIRMKLVSKLFEERKDKLSDCGINISLDELFDKYYK